MRHNPQYCQYRLLETSGFFTCSASRMYDAKNRSRGGNADALSRSESDGDVRTLTQSESPLACLSCGVSGERACRTRLCGCESNGEVSLPDLWRAQSSLGGRGWRAGMAPRRCGFLPLPCSLPPSPNLLSGTQDSCRPCSLGASPAAATGRYLMTRDADGRAQAAGWCGADASHEPDSAAWSCTRLTRRLRG